MKVDLDLPEMSYLLESCLRGSHLRSSTVDRFVNEWYRKFNGYERAKLFECMLRNVYDGKFKPMTSMCGSDIVFMARYNPDNQYELKVSMSGVKQSVRSYKLADFYWVDSNKYVDPDNIVSVRKLTKEEAEREDRFIRDAK